MNPTEFLKANRTLAFMKSKDPRVALDTDLETQKALCDLWYQEHDVMKIIFHVPPERLHGKLKEQAFTLTEDAITLEGTVHYTEDIVNPRVCQQTEGLHINCYNRKNNSILTIQEVPVGSIKYTGYNSMVGLKTIRLSDGRVPIVLGGIYYPSKELYSRVWSQHLKGIDKVEPERLQLRATTKLLDQEKIRRLVR